MFFHQTHLCIESHISMLLSARCDIAMSTQILVAYRSCIDGNFISKWGSMEQENGQFAITTNIELGPAKTSKGAIGFSESL